MKIIQHIDSLELSNLYNWKDSILKIKDLINNSKLELNEAVLILKYILNCDEIDGDH